MTDDYKNILKEIGNIRSTNVISYVLADGNPPFFNSQMGMDVFPIFKKHLESFTNPKNVDIFIYSSGGMLDMPWVLMSILRDYCENISLLVPNKALSAATLLALGMDEIVMGPLGMLSPIDPSTSYKDKDGKDHPLEVEDVQGFIDLGLNRVGIKEEDGKVEILKNLSANINPVTLGNVNRAYARIRQLGDKMLNLHMNGFWNKRKRKKIVTYFTESLYSHSHFIGRSEARDTIGLNTVMIASPELEQKMENLLQLYSKTMYLQAGLKNFDLNAIIKEGENRVETVKCVIESENFKDELLQTNFVTKNGNQVSVAPGPVNWR